MTRTDLHAIVKSLAETKRACPEGYVIPFASLRVKCRDCKGTGWTLDQLGMPMGKLFNDSCAKCAGRGWIPEPDLEKAAWRVSTVIEQEDLDWDVLWWCQGEGVWIWEIANHGLHEAPSRIEAVLWAAQAWSKEQHE